MPCSMNEVNAIESSLRRRHQRSLLCRQLQLQRYETSLWPAFIDSRDRLSTDGASGTSLLAGFDSLGGSIQILHNATVTEQMAYTSVR